MAPPLQGLGLAVVVVTWVEFALVLFFISARYVSRTITINRLGWDDILMGATTLLFLAFSILYTLSATHGLGQHFQALSQDEFSRAYELQLIGQTLGVAAIATSKLGVGLFQLRIVETTWVRWLIVFLVFVMTVACVFEMVVDFMQCIPPDHIWDAMVPARCWLSLSQYVAFSQFLGAWTVVCDFTFAIIPWIVIWPLKMARSRRVWICVSMSWGVFAGICGIIRAVDINELNLRTDYTYDTVPLTLWTATETLVTLGTACIPTYRDLYLRMFKPHELDADNFELDSAVQKELDGTTVGDRTPRQQQLRSPPSKSQRSDSHAATQGPDGSEHSSDPPTLPRHWTSFDRLDEC